MPVSIWRKSAASTSSASAFTLVLLVFGALSVRRGGSTARTLLDRLVPPSHYPSRRTPESPRFLLLMIAQLRRIDFSLCTPRRLRRSHRVGSTAHYLDQTGPVQRSCSRGVVPQVNVEARCTGSRTPSLTRRPHFVFHQVAPASFLRHQQHVIIGDGRRRRFAPDQPGP